VSARSLPSLYVDAARNLRYMDINVSGGTATWGTGSNTETLQALVTGSGIAVAPVSATACFVGGFSSPVYWVRYASYAAGAWTLGTVRYIHCNTDLTWQDGTWLDAEVMPGDATKFILTYHCANGQCQSVIYDADADTYSVPFFVLATRARITCAASG